MGKKYAIRKKYTAEEYMARGRQAGENLFDVRGSLACTAQPAGYTMEPVSSFHLYLIARDMAPNTIAKYLRDVKMFLYFNQGRALDHDGVVIYREYLEEFYEPSSANSMLAALNRFLTFLGRTDCCVHVLRVQREIFRDASRDLTMDEYWCLVKQAEADGNQRLAHVLQTLAGSGIRVSELSSITVESLDQKTVSISSKGKIRQILLPSSLTDKLRRYCQNMGLTAGSIFVTRTGRPLDRRNIWKEMKALCDRAGVPESKAYPHNLRHLFARCFYEKEKDIVRLADYLGHSSVETTRRYTRTSEMEDCRRTLEMGLTVDPEPMGDTCVSGNIAMTGSPSGPWEAAMAGGPSGPWEAAMTGSPSGQWEAAMAGRPSGQWEAAMAGGPSGLWETAMAGRPGGPWGTAMVGNIATPGNSIDGADSDNFQNAANREYVCPGSKTKKPCPACAGGMRQHRRGRAKKRNKKANRT